MNNEKQKVIDFLKQNTDCTVATCLNNKPRASVLEYVMVEDSIIFATDPQSIKAKNIEANNLISFSVYNMPIFVTIDGCIAEPDKAEIDDYNTVLFERHPEFLAMIEKGMMRPFVYYKLVPQVAYFNDYSNGMVPTQIINY